MMIGRPGTVASLIEASIVACCARVGVVCVEAAVDRLLPMFLRRLVRRGSFTVTTAAGQTYTFGDGRGPPVAVRFSSAKAQRSVLLDPELKLGEAYMDGTFVVERGSIVDVLAILFGQERYVSPIWALLPRFVRYLFRRLQQFNPRSRPRHTTSRIPTISTAGFTGSSSTATSNIAAPISNRPTSRSTTRNWPRNAISRRNFASNPMPRCSTSAAAGAAWRSILRTLPARRLP